jgi:plasmid stabilization system protein ParE
MTPRFVFREEAYAEVVDAKEWYAAQAPGLDLEFARAVDAALATVARFPEGFPLIDRDIRRVLLRRFPYQLLYYHEGDDLVVLACFHHRRDPQSWRSRR